MKGVLDEQIRRARVTQLVMHQRLLRPVQRHHVVPEPIEVMLQPRRRRFVYSLLRATMCSITTCLVRFVSSDPRR